VDVPLPLGLAFIELPTVGDVPGVAELAAGSPMVDPRPLGPPLFEPVWFEPVCANASVLESANTPASAIDENFMIGFLIQSLIPNQTAAALDVPTASRAPQPPIQHSTRIGAEHPHRKPRGIDSALRAPIAAGNDGPRIYLCGWGHHVGDAIMQLDHKKIAILATNGFEQSELEVPRDRLKAAGATVHIISLEAGDIKGWDKKDWGRPVKVDKTLSQVSANDYDAIVLPGGQINPDLLRVEPKALAFIKDIFNQKKIVAAICHAPWLLIETGIAKGRKMTSYKSIKTDVANAGAKWEDSEVVVDKGVITSRNPGDLEAFSAKIIEEVSEGKHTSRSAA
jgi:protease I